MGNKNRITWQRWEIPDGHDASRYTGVSVSIFGPNGDHQYVSVICTIANGGGRCTFRCRSLRQLEEWLVIPASALPKLLAGQAEAERQAALVEGRQRALYALRQLPVGVAIRRTERGYIRTDTGELVDILPSLAAELAQAEDYEQEFAEFLARPTDHTEGVRGNDHA